MKGNVVFVMGYTGLVAELWEKVGTQHTLIAEIPVVEKTTKGDHVMRIHAQHSLGIIQSDVGHVWVVRRHDGSMFEKRIVRSYILDRDPRNTRKSDRASDWPCIARYALCTSREKLEKYIHDPCITRDPLTLAFVRTKASS